MFRIDGMLMIGAAGSKVGKTGMACALIKKFSKGRDIIGIKVTTIRAKDGQCPRGGQGCGVCSSLEGDFCITQESSSSSGKDTAKLLAAGATRVFWLRVMKTHLEEGLNALLEVIGRDVVSICESNSLRRVVEPGLFLIVKGHNLRRWKSSARQVKRYADRIVVSDERGFDLDLGRIKLIDGKWVLQEKATAIIMAGGGSSRMGVDKSMLMIGGGPMIERIYRQLCDTFTEVLISSDQIDKYNYLGVRVIPDKVAGHGPLMGIASVLEASTNDVSFVVACDIPYINLAFVRRMLSEADRFDIVVPTVVEKRYEPLFAVYRKSALGAINEVLSAGGRKISDVFKRCRVKYIEIKDASWLVNLNTMSDYEEFRKRHIY